MINTIPVTEARKNLLSLIEEVDNKYKRIDLTKKGVVRASLVSSDYLDELEETLYSLKYSLKDIRLSEKEIKLGKVTQLKSLKRKFSHAG